ncbi:MAG: TIGR02996 domain-containing protein [Gemmataceae bacterium]
MDTYESIYQTILENPEADAPRLVLADWLEEQGEYDRAEFIRVQIAIVQSEPNDPNLEALKRRDEELRKRYEKEWREKLPKVKGVLWGRYNRGFVWHIHVKEPLRFANQAGAIFSANPIISLSTEVADIGPLADTPHISQIRHLDHLIGPESLAHSVRFYRSSNCPQPRTLHWRPVLPRNRNNELNWPTRGDEAIAVLAECGQMGDLIRFDLWHREDLHSATPRRWSVPITRVGAELLLSEGSFPNLCELGVGTSRVGERLSNALGERFQLFQ